MIFFISISSTLQKVIRIIVKGLCKVFNCYKPYQSEQLFMKIIASNCKIHLTENRQGSTGTEKTEAATLANSSGFPPRYYKSESQANRPGHSAIIIDLFNGVKNYFLPETTVLR